MECIKQYNKGVLENCDIDSGSSNQLFRNRVQSFGNEEQEIEPKFGRDNSRSDNEEDDLEENDYR